VTLVSLSELSTDRSDGQLEIDGGVLSVKQEHFAFKT